MKKIRMGALGCSVIFNNVHAQGILNNPDTMELVALCDTDRDKLALAAERYHVKKTYTDCRDMFADADIDAIVNTTPTSEHAWTTIAALQAGKHVLCEKPISMTLAEADDMMAAAKASGKVLQLALQSRHAPAWHKVKELMDDGSIGTPHTITVTQFWNDPYIYKNWRTAAAVSGGGIIADSSVHWIDMMRHLMGEVSAVCSVAVAAAGAPNPAIEDSSLTLFRFASGAIGCLRNGWRNQRRPNCNESVEVNGTTGTVMADLMNPWVTEDELKVELIQWARPAVEFKFTQSRMRFTYQMEDFAACVNGQRAVTCTAEDCRRALVIQEAVYRSLQTKKWEDVP